MPIVVGGIAALVFLAIIVAIILNNRGAAAGQTINNIRCDQGEQLAVHYHAHVDLIYKGQPVEIPAQTGINGTSCFYWLHTHQTTGIIHIEAPQADASRQFTLGDFFAIWNQPLSTKQMATLQVGSSEQLKAWVNGQPYTGNPAKIVLKSHEQVVLEIGPAFVDPPTFDWTSAAAIQEAGTGG